MEDLKLVRRTARDATAVDAIVAVVVVQYNNVVILLEDVVENDVKYVTQSIAVSAGKVIHKRKQE